jgi:hypothetical protein
MGSLSAAMARGQSLLHKPRTDHAVPKGMLRLPETGQPMFRIVA